MTGSPKRPAPLGAVLAGGAATRLGGAKATAELAGRPLISYPLEALDSAGIEAVVVAKENSALPALGVRLIIEPDEPVHPLAGVAAALGQSGSRGAVVVPCDAPLLSPMLLRVLGSAHAATAVRSAGRIHPLIAFYPFESLERLELAVANGDSATHALESLDPHLIEAPAHETFNVNTRGDLVRAESLLKRPRE